MPHKKKSKIKRKLDFSKSRSFKWGLREVWDENNKEWVVVDSMGNQIISNNN